MGYVQDENGQWQYDPADWGFSTGIASAGVLDGALQKKLRENQEAQAEAIDRSATATAQAGGSAGLQTTQPQAYGQTNESGAYAGIAVPSGNAPQPDNSLLGKLGDIFGRGGSGLAVGAPGGGGPIVGNQPGPQDPFGFQRAQTLPGEGLAQIPGEQSVPGHGALESVANYAPYVLGGEASLPVKALEAAAGGAGMYYGSKVDKSLGLEGPFGGPVANLAMIAAPFAVNRGISGIGGLRSAAVEEGRPGVVFKPENLIDNPAAKVSDFQSAIRRLDPEAELVTGKAALQNQLQGLIEKQRTPAAPEPAPAPSPVASPPPPTTGEAAPPAQEPAGAAPAPFTNRQMVPRDQVGPNVPGLVDAEQYGITQAWAGRMENVPPERATMQEMQTGLYNAGLEHNAEAFDPKSPYYNEGLVRQGIPDIPSLYREADAAGIKMPQEQPPSGMPDTTDYNMQRSPQALEARARNEAAQPGPTQGFRDYMADQGRVYPLPRDVMETPVGGTFTDETGRTVTNQGNGRNGSNGGNGAGNAGGFPPSNRPNISRDPNRAAALAINEIVGVTHIPTQFQTIGPHPFRIGAGLELSNPTLIPKVEGAYLNGWKNPAKLAAALEKQRQAPGIAGDGAPGTRYTDFQPPPSTLPRPLATQLSRTLTGGENGILGRNSKAFSGRIDMLKMGVFEKQWEMGQKLGIDDPAWYQKQYQAVQHAGGQAFSGGRTPEAASLTLYAQAGLARLATVGDLIFGTGNPLGVGSRNIALKALVADAALDASILGLSALGGAAVMTPFNTNLTNAFGVNTKIGKAVSGATSIDPSTGYLPLVRLVANLGNDFMNDDRDAAAQHITSFARGQLGPVPGQIANLAVGTDYKGDPFTWHDLGTQKNLADTFSPLGAKGMFDALTTPGGNPYLAGWGLGGVSTTTKQPTQAFTDRMEKTGLSGADLYKVQDKTTPYFQQRDQISTTQGVRAANDWSAQYLQEHPDVKEALIRGDYSVSSGPTSIQPREYSPHNSGIQPHEYSGGTTSITPRDFQPTFRPSKTPTPRNKQPVPVGAVP